MEDVQNIGGTPGMIKFMMDNNVCDGVTGKTHRENLAEHPGHDARSRHYPSPRRPRHLQIMFGNLCPGGGVAKITGKEGETFTVCWHGFVCFVLSVLL